MNRALSLISAMLMVFALSLEAGSGISFSSQTTGGSTASVEARQRPERRVMFDEDIKWATSRLATDRIVDRVANAGFNVYIPCVWHGRGAHFASQVGHIEPRIAARIAAGDDPLTYLLAKAHERGLEVHPWFIVMMRLDTRYPAFYAPETPVDSYDVHNAAFRRFMVELMVDMVKRYPVDGVNLDYIRSIDTCECRQCVSEYGRRFGRSLQADARASRKGGEHAQIAAWNGEAVSEIVREFSTRAKVARRGLVVSIDGHPLAKHMLLQGQDSILWEKNGWVDVIYSMDYRPEPDKKAANAARAALRDPAALTLLLSTYDLVPRERVKAAERVRIAEFVGERAVVSRDPATIAGFVRMSRQYWPGSGVAFYHYKQLTDAHIRELQSSVFSDRVPAAWPAGVRLDKKI